MRLTFWASALALTLAIAACSVFSKQEKNNNSLKTDKTDMPIPPLPTPPPFDYATAWKAVDSLENSGLPKSALEQVNQILLRAGEDKNQQQGFKALVYKGKFLIQTEEEGHKKAIALFKGELAKSPEPQRSMLNSLLGKTYFQYLSTRYWQLRNRTAIEGNDEGEDMDTWSRERLEKAAFDHYTASIQAKAALQAIPRTQFPEWVLEDKNAPFISAAAASMYDLLAAEALSYFNNESNFLTEPTYKFELDGEAAFAPAAQFVGKTFETPDVESRKLKALQLYQELLRYYLAQKNTAALVETDLKRLEFVLQNNVSESKNEWYFKALEALHAAYASDPADAEVLYAMGYHVFARETADKNHLKKAVAYFDEGRQKYPNSYGGINCARLAAELRKPYMSAKTAEIALPDQVTPFLLEYKNLKAVYGKVVRLDLDPQKDGYINGNYRSDYKWVVGLPAVAPIRNWILQDPGDLLQHSTELALPALPPGRYALVLTENNNFDANKEDVAISIFQVSNIAWLVARSTYNSEHFFVQSRSTGAPMNGVKVDCYKREWDNRNSRYRKVYVKSFSSKPNGQVDIDLSNNQHYSLCFSQGKDSTWMENFWKSERDRPQEYISRQVRFFTDRSIYRPGQTIYFKGLLYVNDKKEGYRILPNTPVTVTFKDVNDQVKGTLQLRSNEYGTVNGSFTAPVSGLTGTMSITAEGFDAYAGVNVEEYKRPRFEVKFNPMEGAFALNDKVKIKGNAKAFAGSNVDGAKVTYRVVRETRFPWWGWGWGRRGYPGSSEAREIVNGTTTTDAEGNFEIGFELIPDKKVATSDKPLFNYRVIADVSDINGETRSAETSVSAAYIGLQVGWNLSDAMTRDAFKTIELSTTNLSGQFQAAQGQITLQKLVQPKQYFQKRLWDVPEFQFFQEAEWKRLFPNIPFKKEDEPEFWAKDGNPITLNFNTADNKKIDLGSRNLGTGYYLVGLTTRDAKGNVVELKQVVKVWEEKTRENYFNGPGVVTDKDSYVPGDKAKLLFSPAPAPLYYLYAMHNSKGEVNYTWLNNSETKELNIPITEAHRGGFSVMVYSVYDNRIVLNTQVGFNVPWSEKELQISFETFRDKLAPGQQEEWRIKISGPKKEKVAAEMVAALYDASLDQFLPHGWDRLSFPELYPYQTWAAGSEFGVSGSYIYNPFDKLPPTAYRFAPVINWFDFPFDMRDNYRRPGYYAMDAVKESRAMPAMAPSVGGAAPEMEEMKKMESSEVQAMLGEVTGGVVSVNDAAAPAPPAPPAPPALRKALNETVFFFPELRTDAEGNVILKFTMNEALTRWKLLTFAHSKTLQNAVATREIVTQKELMIIANPPRFLRAGDQFEFSAKVSNLSGKDLNGTATLTLLDAVTMQPIGSALGLSKPNTPFSVKAGQSAALGWQLNIPDDFTGALTWQISADANDFRDGEESSLPVITNRMLVTETMPITVRGNQSKTFTFDNLKNASGGSLKTHNYSLEFTSNPAWYVVQSLPYLMEYPHECSEQMFSRYYANTLAAGVTKKMPQIRRVYERWKQQTPPGKRDPLSSNLQNNQELKYALLEETPWVLAAQEEAQQKQNIALLFDLNRMADEQERTLNRLAERQNSDGSWPWFPGGRGSWYITQYIVSGFAHLEKLGVVSIQDNQQVSDMYDKALGYCDQEVLNYYNEIERRVQEGKTKWEDDHLDGMIIQYLYARSFRPIDRPGKELAYFIGQAERYWLGKGIYQEGMLALALHRFQRPDAAQGIVKSLRERSRASEELGMFWPTQWGYYWHQLPIETQALMVEVFSEVANDAKSVEEMRIWLLKNKQTNRWESTKATAEAVYALLLNGDNWLENNKVVQLSVGGKTLKPTEIEPGTGYFKQSWAPAEVKPAMAEIKVENPNSNIVWGAAYWQYFEDLDKIKTFNKTPLTIVKQLYREKNSAAGPVLEPIADGASLQRGDKIKVRIEIRVDREMEFVHLKDMRAAGFEPVNVLSGYRWQGTLGYYESTKDLATHFFMDYLPKGTHVFEYTLFVSQRGNMSNGITTMQCMYAPEFTAHSKGIRVKVE